MCRIGRIAGNGIMMIHLHAHALQAGLEGPHEADGDHREQHEDAQRHEQGDPAGAAARVPVAQATNLTRALEAYRKAGFFVVGLDGDGDVELPGLELADQPLVIVVGSEGKGLSRLVRETCDQIVSIPIAAVTESLNAGIATAVALYEVSRSRRLR